MFERIVNSTLAALLCGAGIGLAHAAVPEAAGDPPDAQIHFALTPKWSLVGAAGAAPTRENTTEADDSSPALEQRIGLQFESTPRVTWRVEYEHFRFSDALDDRARFGEFSLGVKVGF
jgi:opacity protein-like surface antigen